MEYMAKKKFSPRHQKGATNWPTTQRNGERIIGPLPQWRGPPPPRGSEIFIGKLPRDCFEDELIPLLVSMGPLYRFRLMMDFSGHNRGFGFAIYATPEDAIKAAALLNRYPVRKDCRIGAAISVDNRRLFLNGIDAKLRPDKIAEMLHVNGVFGLSVIEVHVETGKVFALIEFESHTAASQARRILVPDCNRIFDDKVSVEWADPKFLSHEDLKQKRALYIKNITPAITANGILESIGKIIHPIEVQRFSMKEGSALVEFFSHEQAEVSFKKLNKSVIGGLVINVSWAIKNSLGRKQNSLRNITNVHN